MHDLGTLGGRFSIGDAINGSGQIVGSSAAGNGEHAFLYDGTMHDLGVVNGNFSEAHAISSNGLVTGVTRNGGILQQAFLWTPTVPNGSTGTMVSVGTLGGDDSDGLGINAAGHITGATTYISGTNSTPQARLLL